MSKWDKKFYWVGAFLMAALNFPFRPILTVRAWKKLRKEKS